MLQLLEVHNGIVILSSNLKDKIDQASRKMEDVDVRSRAITKKLRDVEELPSNPQPLLKDFLQTDNID